MKEPKKFTEEEIKKIINENHRFIINDIECNIRLYIHSFNFFSILIDCYTYQYNDITQSFVSITDTKKFNNLLQYLSSCDEVEIIEKNTNKKGYYKISLQASRDGDIKFLRGDDVLEYKKIIFKHQNLLETYKIKYNNIDFSNYILLINNNSKRSYKPIEKESKDDYKEFDILDDKYFNYLISNYSNKKFGIIREMIGVNFIHIYTECEITSYNKDRKTILFKFFRKTDEIMIHKDLKIDPIKEYKAYKRKQKISCLLK